ncbi:MAG: hypothetical protein C0502_10785 [Opitutus sp.]|nr:hypothetical protein [Opitutus sp.]
MVTPSPLGATRLFLLLAFGLGAAGAVFGQSVLYFTDGDSSRLQAVNVTTGQLVFTATTSSLAYPIAVRDTIALGHRDSPGLTGQYNLTDGSLIGSTQAPLGTPNWSQTVDGAAAGNFNYTFAAFSNSTTVYRTDANWANATVAFTLTGSDLVGITYDINTGNLWVSDTNTIYQYTTSGTLVSQFSKVSGRAALAYQSSTDTLWLVPNSSSSPLLQYSKSGTLLQSLTVGGRSGNVFGAEFQAIPEPSTCVLLGLGLGFVAWFCRRRG